MKSLSDVFRLTILTILVVGQVYGASEEDRKDAYQIFLEEKEGVSLHTFAHVRGNVQEKNWKEAHVSFFYAISPDLETIVNCDADVVCIQNIESHQVGRDCYEF